MEAYVIISSNGKFISCWENVHQDCMGYREEDVITLDNINTILLDVQDTEYCTEDINNGDNRILYGNFTADKTVKVNVKLEQLI